MEKVREMNLYEETKFIMKQNNIFANKNFVFYNRNVFG